jgi:uncharacterized protein (DUF1800 family)
VNKSSQKPAPITVADNAVKGLLMGAGDAVKMEQLKNNLTKEQKQQFRKQSREDLKNLTLAWMDEMVNSEAQLREKMSLFWHGHFACVHFNIFYQQQLLDVIRQNALGNFGDLLRGVSKSASMLAFLNNQQNRKQHPNENFAREVMELFTLGRGNYTETDVKEAARAFTGWGFNVDGDFVFRKFAHDDGVKNVLGKSGNFDGDDVLNILLEQQQCATFITKKIYKYFVNENIDDHHVQWLSKRFYDSNYDIASLMKDIFSVSWFYDDVNVGAHIKSPVELMVGIRRMLPMQIENEPIQILLQRALGQLLFYPPNVAGWPGGKNWIDSSTLMLRLRIPQLIQDDDAFFITPKSNDDIQMGMRENTENFKGTGKKAVGKSGFQIMANVDWDAYTKQFANIPQEQLYPALENILLQTPASSVNKQAVINTANNSTRDSFIQSVSIALMSTPEYQLC